MTNSNTTPAPMAYGQLIFLPYFFNLDQVKRGEMARTSPFESRDEILPVKIEEIVRNGNAGLVYFRYMLPSSGASSLYVAEVKSRVIAPDRRYHTKVRRLWVLASQPKKAIYISK